MIKKFKNVPYKSSIVTILLFTITTPFISTNCFKVNAMQREITTIESVGKYTESQHNFIIDAPVKSYDNIEKLEQVSNFKFKIPDFIPEGNKVSAFQLRKLSEKCNAIEIFLENLNGSFSFQIFQGDPFESLKNVERDKTKAFENVKIDGKKEPLKIGGINGLNVTLSTTFPDRKVGNSNFIESQKITKYFIWQNEGLWYSVEYKSESKSKDSNSMSVNLPQSDILQIAQSIKYPEDLRNVKYLIVKDSSTESPVMNVYDKEDLEKAKNILGFNPKFPVEIDKELNITSSIVRISDNSNKENNKKEFEINNFYNNKNGSIIFAQGKDLKYYKSLEKNDYLNEDENGSLLIKPEKLVLNYIEIFKYSSRGIVPQISYLWKENDIYYSLTFYVNIENSDEIVKKFINTKPI